MRRSVWMVHPSQATRQKIARLHREIGELALWLSVYASPADQRERQAYTMRARHLSRLIRLLLAIRYPIAE